MLKGVAETFDDFSNKIFIPYIKEKLEMVKRVDVVWDCYEVTSLKSQEQGKGTRTRVDGKNVKVNKHTGKAS